ncbi:MAG: hypothetical protein CMJ77_21705 [Planctomycetaceae bacterium]|nr:hypothetical protein [Planctomycetaceae bacterium]
MSRERAKRQSTETALLVTLIPLGSRNKANSTSDACRPIDHLFIESNHVLCFVAPAIVPMSTRFSGIHWIEQPLLYPHSKASANLDER